MSSLPLPLKGHMVNHGVTIKAFAEEIGVSQQHATAVLNRRAPLTRQFAQAAVQVLGLGVDEAALLLGPPSTWTRGRWPHRA